MAGKTAGAKGHIRHRTRRRTRCESGGAQYFANETFERERGPNHGGTGRARGRTCCARLEAESRAKELAPHSVDDALALVRSAVQFNDLATAERALAAVDESGRNIAPYHAASALVAQSKHQDEKAETEWSGTFRLTPDDKSYQLQLGMLRMRANDPERRGSGETMLTALRSDPAQRSAATGALISAGIAQREDPHKLMELARELQAYPEATWA